MTRTVPQEVERDILGMLPGAEALADAIEAARPQPRKFTMESVQNRTAFEAVVASVSARNRHRARSCNHGEGQS